MFTQGLLSPRHPILAQLVVTRRCNLACAYCSEFDHASAPVPTAELLRRVDRLADLGTAIIALSGGEPLLHRDADAIIARIRARGALAALLTNGLLLTGDRIRRLNRAGLDYLQISIDNLVPDAASRKSLTLLDRRLEDLAAFAEFQVTINSVVGASDTSPEDACQIALRARSLGFTSTVGIVHDARGQLRGLHDGHRDAVERIQRLVPSLFSFSQLEHFQENIVRGLPNRWDCRAGGRFLYVCEDGLVHYCSQRRGLPGKPLETYSDADLVREANRPKPCAPLCTVSCVHQVALLDRIRERPRETLASLFEARQARDPDFRVPVFVKLLTWAFVDARRGAGGAGTALRPLTMRGRKGAPAACPARTTSRDAGGLS